MIDSLKDISKVSFFLAGVSTFTFLSFLGRVNRDLSQGMLVLFTALHIIALLLGLICIGIAIGQRSPESGNDGVGMTVLLGSIPAIGLLLTIWIGCGLGFWVGS